MKLITSLANPEVKLVTSLHHSKYRKEHNLFIAEGLRTCSTLIQSGMTPTAVYATAEVFDEVSALVNPELITDIMPDVLAKMSTATTPSGLLMVFPIPAQPALTSLSHGLVLAQISDPGNMGTLFRSAAAMNIKTIVCVESCDPWSPKVVQASAGTIASLSIFQISWKTLLEYKQELKLCALVVHGGNDPKELDLAKSLLVIGSEARGIPAEWIANCEQKLTLAMPGKIESLNAAVAGSIAMYEAFGGR